MSASSLVRVVITGDTKGAQKALAETRAEAGKTGTSLKSIGKMAAIGALAAAAGAVAVGSMLVKAGDKLNESQDMLKNALKDTGQSSEGLDRKLKPLMDQMQKWGYTNDEVNTGLAALVRAGDKVTTATKDMALAADVAKGRNIDLATAEQLIVKVRTGHVSLLGRYGIAVKDANGKIISQQEAITKLSAMYSGAANTSTESLKGKQEALHAAFTNLTEHLGQKLIPILTGLAEWFVNTFIPDFEAGTRVLTDIWNKVWAAVAPVIAKIRDGIATFITVVQALWQRFGSTIVTFVTDTFGSVKTVIGGVLKVLEGIFDTFRDLVTGKWGKLWGDVLTIFSGVWKIIRGAIGAAFAEVKLFIGGVWDAIGTTVEGAWNGLVTFFEKAPGRIGKAALAIGSAIYNGIKNGISGALGEVSDLADAVWTALKGFLNRFLIDPANKVLSSIDILGYHPFGKSTLPSFHTGGVFNSGAGEGLALLRDGEGIFTPAQMAALGAGRGTSGGGGGNVIQNFHAPPTPSFVNAQQVRWNRRNGRG